MPEGSRRGATLSISENLPSIRACESERRCTELDAKAGNERVKSRDGVATSFALELPGDCGLNRYRSSAQHRYRQRREIQFAYRAVLKCPIVFADFGWHIEMGLR